MNRETARVVLASSSPGRRSTLRGAGIEPEILSPEIDEPAIHAELGDHSPCEVVTALARAKAVEVERILAAAGGLPGQPAEVLIIVGCDSMLDIGGELKGKPATPSQAKADFRSFSGRWGTVHTGQHVVVYGRCEESGPYRRELTAESHTEIRFAQLVDQEIEAFVATGEPLRVAGCTIEGIGGAFITEVRGDPHGVGGLSLPLFREMVLQLGAEWSDLWNRPSWIVENA